MKIVIAGTGKSGTTALISSKLRNTADALRHAP